VSDLAESLARRVRAALGEFDDPDLPVVSVVRKLADRVREAADALEAARADARVLRRGNERLAEALREVMLWIENWSPPFTEDDEWPDTEAKAKAALHTTAAQENDDA